MAKRKQRKLKTYHVGFRTKGYSVYVVKAASSTGALHRVKNGEGKNVNSTIIEVSNFTVKEL